MLSYVYVYSRIIYAPGLELRTVRHAAYYIFLHRPLFARGAPRREEKKFVLLLFLCKGLLSGNLRISLVS